MAADADGREGPQGNAATSGTGPPVVTWTHDLVVIGAGAAGLTAAGGAARLGLRVALIERDRMGGECLNTGCVPSKALLAAARRAHLMRTGAALGITAEGVSVDFAQVSAHVQEAITAIAPHDSAERFQAWGVEVIRGAARFTARRRIEVAGRTLTAPRIVVAAGSRPAIPAIEGLRSVPYLTNETLFALDRLPGHLVILGGGPMGLEMAQAFRRLGSAVTLIEPGRLLSHADPEAVAVVVAQLAGDGVDLRPGTQATRVMAVPGGVRIDVARGVAVTGTHLLVAAGRTPALEDLGLDAAGIAATPAGITVDRRRRTSNRHVTAIGDCRAGPRLTHAAGYEGTLAVANIALGLPLAARYDALPSVLYTDPELAQIGLTEAEAQARHRTIRVHRLAFADNDRAVADGATTGFIKVIHARGQPVGVTIVGAGAGELALPWVLAIGRRASTWAISGAIVPYPTRSEASKAAAFSTYERLVFGRPAQTWARALAALRRT